MNSDHEGKRALAAAPPRRHALSWGRPRGDEIAVSAGACLSQPAGMRHNVAFYSDDLELIEINIPADYATNEH
jgi:hypothetical protein